jgi:hypothetical protein
MPRKNLRVLLALAAAAISVTAAAPAAHADQWDDLMPPPGYCVARKQVDTTSRTPNPALCLINKIRQNYGLKRLSVGCRTSTPYTGLLLGKCRGARYADRANLLNNAAVQKTRDILNCQEEAPSPEWAHYACGLDINQRVLEQGYVNGCSSWSTGENYYYGSGAYGSARAAVTWWMHSDGHRANILNPNFTQMGIWAETGELQGEPDTAVWILRLGSCT